MKIVCRLALLGCLSFFSLSLWGMERVGESEGAMAIADRPGISVQEPVMSPAMFFSSRSLPIDLWRKILALIDPYDPGFRYVARYIAISDKEASAIADDIDSRVTLHSFDLNEWLQDMEHLLSNDCLSLMVSEVTRERRLADYIKNTNWLREHASIMHSHDRRSLDKLGMTFMMSL